MWVYESDLEICRTDCQVCLEALMVGMFVAFLFRRRDPRASHVSRGKRAQLSISAHSRAHTEPALAQWWVRPINDVIVLDIWEIEITQLLAITACYTYVFYGLFHYPQIHFLKSWSKCRTYLWGMNIGKLNISIILGIIFILRVLILPYRDMALHTERDQ